MFRTFALLLFLFPANGLFYSGHNVGSPQTVFVHQEGLGTHLTEHILHTHKFLHGGMVFRQTVGYRTAKTADNIVIFGGDNSAGLGGTAQNQLLIQGLPSEHIHYPHGNTLGIQCFVSFQSLVHHDTGGDDGGSIVAALMQHHALAQGEFRIVAVDPDDVLANKTSVGDAVTVRHLLRDSLQLCVITGVGDHRFGDGQIHGCVLQWHMGAAVESGAHARIGAEYMNRQIRVSGRHVDLVIDTAAGEGTEGVEIPCGAKVPFIAMIAGAIFGGSAWVATSAYFIGMLAIITSGIMLKKTKMFAGDPAPFVMELPAYHLPTLKNVLRSMWERGWSFIKKAGTIILLSTILVWFTTYFGFTSDGFRMLSEEEPDQSILAAIGSAIAWIFVPLGWGTWQAAVASITGLVAKENIVGTMGILYGGSSSVYATFAETFSGITGYSFLVFNLLCAPCFAAIGAIRREMNNAKWTWFAIAYQCGFAYAISLMINQFGGLFTGNVNIIGVIAAVIVLGFMIWMLVRPYKESTKLTKEIKVS